MSFQRQQELGRPSGPAAIPPAPEANPGPELNRGGHLEETICEDGGSDSTCEGDPRQRLMSKQVAAPSGWTLHPGMLGVLALLAVLGIGAITALDPWSASRRGGRRSISRARQPVEEDPDRGR